MRKLLSIFLLIVICMVQASPAFAISEGTYKDIWNDLSSSEREAWCTFLSSMPKLSVSLAEESRTVTADDVFSLLTENLNNLSSEYKDENMFDFQKYVNKEVIGQDYESELIKIFGEFLYLSVGEWYNADAIDEILHRNYGLEPNRDFHAFFDGANASGYSEKYNSYIIGTYADSRNYSYMEFIPDKIFYIKDDIYYIESLCNLYGVGYEYGNYALVNSYESYFILKINADDWRLYEFSNTKNENGEGWLSDGQLEEKLSYIDELNESDESNEYEEEGINPIEFFILLSVLITIVVVVLKPMRKKKIEIAAKQEETPGINVDDIEKEKRVAKYCTNCGTLYQEGAKFCVSCGNKLE